MNKKIIGDIINKLARVEGSIDEQTSWGSIPIEDRKVLDRVSEILGKCIDDINKIYCSIEERNDMPGKLGEKYITALEDKIIQMSTDYNIELEDDLFDNILDNFKQKYNKKGV